MNWDTWRGNRAHMSDSTVAHPKERLCGMASTRPSELFRQVRGASPLLDVNMESPLGTGVLGVSPNTRASPLSSGVPRLWLRRQLIASVPLSVIQMSSCGNPTCLKACSGGCASLRRKSLPLVIHGMVSYETWLEYWTVRTLTQCEV